MPKILVLKVNAENENYYAETNYALLSLSDKDIAKILALSLRAKREGKIDESFHSLVFKSPVMPLCVDEDEMGLMADLEDESGLSFSEVEYLDLDLSALKEIGKENEISIPTFRFWNDGDITFQFYENDQTLYSEMFNHNTTFAND